jgi:hypothetical protein
MPNPKPKPKAPVRTAAGEAMKSFNKPSTVKKTDAVVREMINKSQEKKSFANKQEKIAKDGIKSGNNSVRVVDLKGTTTPTPQKRLEMANKLKQEAKRDSLAAVSMSKKSAPTKKKK